MDIVLTGVYNAKQALDAAEADLREIDQAATQAASGTQALGKAADNMGRELVDSADQGALVFDDLTEGIGQGLGAITAAAAATQKLLDQFEQFYMLGASAERAAASLDTLTGGRADVYIRAVGDASMHTIDQMTAMEASARALRLGVVTSAEDMQELTEVAVAMGRTMGVDAAQALNDMVTGIGRMSPMILDNLGLTIKQASLQEEVNRLMEEMPGLTEAEAGKMALLNQVLAQGNVLLAEMGGVTMDAAAEMEFFSATLRDGATESGRGFVEAMQPVLRWLRELRNPFTELNEEQRMWVERARAVGMEAERITTPLGHQVMVTEELIQAVQEYESRLSMVTEYQRQHTAAVEEHVEAVEVDVEAMAREAESAYRVGDAMMTVSGAYHDTMRELHGMGTEADRSRAVGEAFIGMLDAAGLSAVMTADELGEYRYQMGLLTQAEFDLFLAQQIITDALRDGKLSWREAADVFEDYVEGVIGGIDALEARLGMVMGEVTTAMISTGLESMNAGEFIQGMGARPGSGAITAAGAMTITVPVILDGREVGRGAITGTLDALASQGIALAGASN
jgi:hypothetical protein